MNTWNDEADVVLREVAELGKTMTWPQVGPRLPDGREPSPNMMRTRMRELNIYGEWKQSRKTSKW